MIMFLHCTQGVDLMVGSSSQDQKQDSQGTKQNLFDFNIRIAVFCLCYRNVLFNLLSRKDMLKLPQVMPLLYTLFLKNKDI